MSEKVDPEARYCMRCLEGEEPQLSKLVGHEDGEVCSQRSHRVKYTHDEISGEVLHNFARTVGYEGVRLDRDRLLVANSNLSSDLKKAESVVAELRALTERDLDLLELAWGVVANAGGGNWKQETADWQAAAARWRERFLARLDKRGKP